MRGPVAFCPKWASDQDPDSRLACVIKRSESPGLFLSLYGHIDIIDDASLPGSLEELLGALGAADGTQGLPSACECGFSLLCHLPL